MDRRRFAGTTLAGLVAMLFGARKDTLSAPKSQALANQKLISNWESYPTKHTVTLRVSEEDEAAIAEGARFIRLTLAARNVHTPELDAIDAAYRHSMRQRIGKTS
jgi:hypothetical protein